MLRSLSLVAALSLLVFAASASAQAARRPNVVVILADDIGYGDLGCQGATLVSTPNIDRIAREGRRCLDAHSPASTCTPTRRSLLTGAYSWRQPPGSTIAPGDAALSIPPGTVTAPSVMRQAGYRTGIVGKWHLGLGPEGGPDWNGEITPGPREVGFDDSFIMPATGDRAPCVYVENGRVVGLDPNDPIRVSYQAKVGSEPTGKENPELLKLRPTHGHDMTIVNGVSRIGWMSGGKKARWVDEEMADTFTRRAVRFLEENRQRPFFLYFATHNIHVPRVPNPRFQGASKCGTRGDAIQELDASVGEVLRALDRLKLADNTLLIFTSDNGGVMDDGYEDVGSLDHQPNGALRGRKGTVFEGGHRVPFLVRWPGHVPPGSTNRSLIAHTDLTATLASLVGQALPAEAAPDSFNVLTAWTEEGDPAVRPHFVAHNGGIRGPFGVRRGPWKLVLPGPMAAGGQLFNLEEDLSETTDVAAAHPDRVAELRDLFRKGRRSGRSR